MDLCLRTVGLGTQVRNAKLLHIYTYIGHNRECVVVQCKIAIYIYIEKKYIYRAGQTQYTYTNIHVYICIYKYICIYIGQDRQCVIVRVLSHDTHMRDVRNICTDWQPL